MLSHIRLTRPQKLSFQTGALLLLIAVLNVGCSDSASIGNFSDPPLVFPVKYPLLFQGDLHEYDPVKKTAEKVLSLEGRDFVILDTDGSKNSNDYLDRSYVNRNALPDFIAFANERVLSLFDMETRRIHALYDFQGQDNIDGQEYICNITKSTSAELGSLEEDKLNFIEDRFIYVEALPLSDSVDCASTLDKRFYKILIRNSSFESFRIRQPSETDESNLVSNTFPVLYGEKTLTDEALMYSGKPVIDPANDIELHLGFELNSKQLRAYLTNIENEEQQGLWSLTGDQFDRQAQERKAELVASDAIDNLHNRGPAHVERSSALILQHGNDIVKIGMNALLDDDASVQRTSAINNPVVDLPESPLLPKDSILYASSNDEFYFQYQEELQPNKLYVSDNGNTDVNTFDLSEDGIDDKSLLIAGSDVLIVKRYTADNSKSIVRLASNGIESTILPTTLNELSFNNYGKLSDPTVTLQNPATNSWNSLIYSTAQVRNPAEDGTVDTIAVPLYDGRFYYLHDEETEELFALFFAENQSNANALPALSSPSLFRYSGNPSNARAGEMASLDEYLYPSSSNYVYIYTDDFGLAQLTVLVDGNPELRYFYFDPVNTVTEPELPSQMELIPLPYD